ncbi:response regulator transcription factor [Streptomyces olivaceus]|uniref:helix-turn-helix transcriptional regulator n=1 Tax=Streptomyces olivaceus TaxID=47716 RepID=UPI001CCAEB1A|nr:LuxR C-terminal-related transcriptional regulator [Streptomyces olivaceus]MBZ6287137.1 LuxR C-terminal-related transcriptional regulator [Streptomyces olivaceus]
MGLDHRDYEALLALSVHALEQAGSASPWPALVGALRGHLGVEAVTLTEIARERSRPLAWAPGRVGEGRVRELSRQSMRSGHPLVGHYRQARDSVPRTAEDLAGSAVWRNSAARSVAREHFGAGHILGLPCALPSANSGVLRGCVVYSRTRFSPAQHLFLRRAQPLLAAVDAQERVMGRMQEGAGRRASRRAREYGLTQRELAVLTLLGEALPAKGVATRLGISVRTVHKHMQNLYRKLGTRDRMETVLLAQSLGLLRPGSPALPPHADR